MQLAYLGKPGRFFRISLESNIDMMTYELSFDEMEIEVFTNLREISGWYWKRKYNFPITVIFIITLMSIKFYLLFFAIKLLDDCFSQL